ncbi:MAG: recombinase family protein [Dehalococcoidia bacterium]|nr:recombinase family protein [Dehalococcoidia bacterium]
MISLKLRTERDRMKRAVLHARVSSEEQVDTWSIPAQKREFEDYCHYRGWQAARVYCEEGVSARWE